MSANRLFILGAATLTAATTLWSLAPAAPAPGFGNRRYEVTITNVTRGQVFSPAVIASHDANVSLFELGAPASAELAQLAEEGDPSLLAALLQNDPGSRFVASTGGPLMPGQSVTVTILVDGDHPYLSVAGMLVSTNDALFAARGLRVPEESMSLFARAYDAGSEFNSEDCAFIPGPPCASAGAHDPAPAEGFVRIHEGIHGIGGLAPSLFDWRGEVAAIRVERVTP